MIPPRLLTQCLRFLLLPIRPGNEAGCARELRQQLAALGVLPADFLDWAKLQAGLWNDESQPSAELKRVVRAVLERAGAAQGSSFPSQYFQIHKRLVDEHLMSHEEARAFLSNALLMEDLAAHELLSAAQITRLLSGRDARVGFSRQSVSFFLRTIELEPALQREKIRRLFKRDADFELAVFADADLQTAAEIVDSAAAPLGFPGTLIPFLKTLTPPEDLSTYGPYLQIIHYQCMIAEFYDHALTDVYEFSPRGVSALWLFGQYPETLATAGNPFLNNMKSVGKVDEYWARSKKDFPGAFALLQVLEGLEAMSFAARREAAKFIRLWIHRVMRLSAPFAVPLPLTLTPPHLIRLLDKVSEANTATYGILEQRVVDAVSLALHTQADGWRSRGVGDSVNTTNISRRKLGDCDFQNSATRTIVAYEAHGGVLSDVYVNEHLRTLKKIMLARAEELTGIAELDQWTITIVFVAHHINTAADVNQTIEGVTVTLRFETFPTFLALAPVAPLALPDWDRELLTPLGSGRTPLEVRRTLMAIIEAE